MTRPKKRRAMGAALGLAGILSLPYLAAFALTPPERTYLGHIWNPDEPNVYYAWMRQASEGRFFLEDLFTTEPQQGRFTNAFWLILGWASAIHPDALPWVYAGARFLCAAGLFYSIYAFAAGLGATRNVRWAAMLLGASASGLGWLCCLMAPHLPPSLHLNCVDIGLSVGGGVVRDDLMMPEVTTFTSALLLPLFSFSMILLLWLVLMAWRALREGDLRAALWSGLLGLLLGNVHTYDMIPMHVLWVTLLLCTVALRQATGRSVLAYLIFAAVSAPTLLYQVFAFGNDPVFQEKGLTITASPSILSYLVSLGIPLLLAAAGAVFVLRRREWQWLPAVCWVVVGLACAYLPGVSFQRKMIEGVHLPILVLAAVAVVRWLPCLRQRPRIASHRRRAVAMTAAALLACLPSSAYFLVGRCMASVANNNLDRVASALMPPYTLHDDDVACALWLRDSGGDGAVGCLPMLGSYLPGITGRKVWVGHWAETLRFRSKLNAAVALLVTPVPKEAEGMLKACRYVVDGEFEQAFRRRGQDPTLTAQAAGYRLTRVFSSGGSTVYEVTAEGPQRPPAPPA